MHQQSSELRQEWKLNESADAWVAVCSVHNINMSETVSWNWAVSQ